MFWPAPLPPLQSFPLGLCSSCAAGDNVLASSSSSSPVLSTGPIHSLLCRSDCMHGGHESLHDGEVVIDNLGYRSQAVGGAGSIANNLHVGSVGVLINPHDEHGSISRGGRDDDLLSASSVVSRGLLQGGEDASALHHVLRAHTSPGDGGRVPLHEHRDLLAIYHQLVARDAHVALVLPVGRVVFEHVDHVVQGNERVINSHNLRSLGKSSSEHKSSNASKSVDTDGRHNEGLEVSEREEGSLGTGSFRRGNWNGSV